MSQSPSPGRIVLLNGVPRAGKTSIVRAIQESFDGVWVNLGVDGSRAMTPARYQPGIGLRPGGERPDLEPIVVSLFAGLYEAIAAHSRLGVDVVVDVGHHDGYSAPLGILPACARRLVGLPAWLVGVRCPIEVILERRQATWGAGYDPDGSIPAPVLLFQEMVHTPGIYDLEVDTSRLTPAECAVAIRRNIEQGPPPTALSQLAALGAG
jgi:chloramphenicol 3-O phosphotransferase